jgi:hypothetical protein
MWMGFRFFQDVGLKVEGILSNTLDEIVENRLRKS